MIPLLILMIFLLVIPIVVGGLFAYVEQGGARLLFRWVSGQMLLWAGFQLVCVPLILKDGRFSQVVVLFCIYMAAMVLLAVAAEMRRLANGTLEIGRLPRLDYKKQLFEIVFWLVFFGILLFQLLQGVRLLYADGDDAYYVAISTVTKEADTMYRNLPYTGGETGLDARHALAPFPVWISFLAQISGMRTVTVAKVALPCALLPMTYAIFYLIGVRLFPERGARIPVFLIFTEWLVLFGDYSIYTVENFMIARSRQGKAALGSIVIPFLFLVLLLLLQKLQAKERVPASLYLLFAAVAVSACLCSTLGAVVICMPIGIVGALGGICYRRLKILPPLAACCLPCAGFALLYLFLAQ